MSKRRREWKESLRPDIIEGETLPEKKEKIRILKDETYKNVNGEMILVSTQTNKMEIQNNNTLEDCKDPLLDITLANNNVQNCDITLHMKTNDNNAHQDCTKIQQMTPHQPSEKFTSLENLTPTYRKPDLFLAETKEVMKSITPVKLFPKSSDMQSKENFKIIPPYYAEQDEEGPRYFSNLNNIQSMLRQHNHEAEFNELNRTINNDINRSFTIEIDVEPNNSQEKNENISPSELISIKYNEIVEMITYQNSDSKQKTNDEIKNCKINNFVYEENKNITEEYNESEAVDLNISNCNSIEVNSILEKSLEIHVVHAEIHDEPKKKIKGQGDGHKGEKIVIQPNTINEDEIVITSPEDKTITVLSNCETSDAATETKQKSRTKRSRRNILYDKSYLDYMSDEDFEQKILDEAFPSEGSSEECYTDENPDSSNDEQKDLKSKTKKNQKKKKKKKNHEINEIEIKKDHNISADRKKTKTAIRRENKEKKKIGEAYTNNKGELVKSKSIKPNPCKGKNCGNECGNISEERRQSLFSYFWNLKSHQRRKDWIAQCAVKKTVKRPSKDNNIRSCTYNYFINEGEGRRKVCQKYLINTLDITQRFILYTLETMVDGYAKTDERGISGGHNKTKEQIIEHAKKIIESLPTMPSHYCRKDSNKLYFPEEFKNMTILYRIYKDNCRECETKGMSFQVFLTWFKKTYSIGFHVPKKDKCLICSNKNSEEKSEEEKEKIERHIKEKDESYKRFKYHQNIHSKDKGIICASFDMQKVLNTPYGDSMMLYYSRKLAVYNFTIYESITRKGYCNLWTETDAHRGANEICTCLFNYIKELDSYGSVKTLLLYCDSCYGQNKNKSVLSMIRYVLSQCKTIKTIQINYLIPGHTYMPVDSVHATIESKVKKSTIWAPSQWPTIMEVARQDPEPYKVEVLKGTDFIGFDNVVNNTFKKNQKIAISKLNIATFKKEEPNLIYIKNSMRPDAETTKIPLLPLNNMVDIKKNLYPTQLGISVKKHKDLKNLVNKNIIPSRFAEEFKNFKINNKIKDCLIDTDDEDKIENEDNDYKEN